MNRFVIVDGLPYLFSNGKTYAVRWDDKGFTVGAEVNLASVPDVTYSEVSILAKCANNLDSIKAINEHGKAPVSDEQELEEMTVAELREYAKENDIDLDGARSKAAIIAVIKEGEA